MNKISKVLGYCQYCGTEHWKLWAMYSGAVFSLSIILATILSLLRG